MNYSDPDNDKNAAAELTSIADHMDELTCTVQSRPTNRRSAFSTRRMHVLVTRSMKKIEQFFRPKFFGISQSDFVWI